MSKENGIFFNFLINIIKNFKKYFFIFFITGISIAFYLVYSPLILKKITNLLVQTSPDLKLVYQYCLIYIGLFFAIFVINRIFNINIDKNFSIDVKKYIMNQFSDYILFFKHEPNSEKKNVFSNKLQILIGDANELITLFGDDIFKSILLIIFSLFLLSQVDKIFFFTILIYLLIFIILSFLFVRKNLTLSYILSFKMNAVFESFNNIFLNLSLIKIFQKNKIEKKIIEEKINETFEAENIMRESAIFLLFIQGFLTLITNAILIISMIWLKILNIITIGDFVLIIGIFSSLSDRIWKLNVNLMRIALLSGRIKQNLLIFDEKYFINNELNHQEKENKIPENFLIKEKIRFENIYFDHDIEDNMPGVFNNFSLELSVKKRICIIGDRRSGKTTLLKLLSKIIKQDLGSIFFDEICIDQIDDEKFYNLIATHFHLENFINCSVKENLCPLFNETNNSKDFDEAMNLIKKFDLDSFIQNLPEKYDTKIETSNHIFNSENRQIFGLIRVLMKRDSQILILDDPSKEIAKNNLESVHEMILEFSADKTLIISTNDFHLATKMDIIFLLEEGKIIESGSPNELLEKDSKFKKYFQEYLGQACKIFHDKINL